MNKNEFWALIDSVNAKVPHYDQEAILKETKQALLKYTQEDIMDWQLIMDQYKQAAYRNDLWAASAALGAHYSDDGFIDFRYWLISCGRQIYMDALKGPDSLASIKTAGELFNFERYGYVASDAYELTLPPAPDGEDNWLARVYAMSNRLKSYRLDPRTVLDIQAELPQRPDLKGDWSPHNLPDIVPRICALHLTDQQDQTVVHDKMEQLLEGGEVICAYVYGDDAPSEYMFRGTPENIAWFIGSRPFVSKIVLTDPMDRLVLNTRGFFIDQCPDKALLDEVKKTLIPIQMGQEEAMPFFCPTMEEVEKYRLEKSAFDIQLN